jgi:diadenosine tetraphosphate (Ap4A) HIT family hydrolase
VLADTGTMAAFRDTFRLDGLTVHAARGWALSVRPGQLTLGSMVISSEDGHLDFSGFDADTSAGLADAFALAERLAKDLFGAVRVNLVCLMMKDPVVHFHVVPRYEQPVERYGLTWEDADWPGPPTFGPAPTSDEVLRALAEDLGRAAR